MRRWVFGLLLCAAPMAAQRPDSTLAGLTAIRVRIRLNATSSVPVPIDTAVLMREVTHDLTAHGWRVARDDEDSTATWPTLSIVAEVFEYKSHDNTVYLTRYDYGLVEQAKPVNRPAPAMLARTWTGGTTLDANDNIQLVGAKMLSALKRIVANFNAARGPIGRRA